MMLGSVKQGPSHYEILGLTPSATGDDIEQAFATRMKMRIANPEEADDYRLRLRAAYKTLHDPFWRRIYDAELGLASKARPEPAKSHPPQSAAEQRVAPFIAAALRQSSGPTEHPASPDFLLFPDAEEKEEEAESVVEEGPEPFIAGIDDRTAGERSVPDARGRWSEWNRAGAATGVAILGLGLVALLIGLWGTFDRSPKTARAPASARVEQIAPRAGSLTQTAPQQAAPIEEESLSSSVGTSIAPVEANGVDPVPADISAVGDRAQAQGDRVADTQIAEQPESTTVANSADPLAPAAASASAAESPTAAPVTVAQAPPEVGAQAVSPAPAVRPAPVVNRAAAPKWISGGLVNSDNPRGRYRGRVTVRFTVQPTGRVSGCRTAVSSGSTALDARTCQLVEQRLRFRPALNWQGRAIPYETRAIYTWGAKHRSLLDQLFKPRRR